MKITAKGQVTIPQEIRRKAKLLPFTEINFDYRNGEVIIKKSGSSKRRGKKIVDRIKSLGPISMTTKELMKMTRGGK